MIKEKINSLIIQHWGIFERVMNPLAAGFFSVGALTDKRFRRFLAKEIFEDMERNGDTINFAKITGRVLSRLGHPEVENAMLEGKEVFRARYYEEIPRVYWSTLDKLF